MKEHGNRLLGNKRGLNSFDMSSSILIASAGEYGGVATHLNHFYSVLSGLIDLKKVILFSPDSPEISKNKFKHSLSLYNNNTSSYSRFNIFRRFFPKLTNFFSEFLFVLNNRDEFFSDKVIISSHEPYGYWGYTIFSKEIDYYIFVLPDADRYDGEGLRLSRILTFMDLMLFQIVIKIILKIKKTKCFAQTDAGAKIWADEIGLNAKDVIVLPNPPFIVYENESLITDNQPGLNHVDEMLTNIKGGSRLVLSIGHVSDYKNPKTWVDFAKKATATNPDYVFVWVGDGPIYDEMLECTKGFENICFLGRLNQKDIRKLYEHAWLFFHPALHESQGIVIFDALAFGVPVYLNKTAVLGTLLKGVDAGFSSDLASSQAINEFLSVLRRLEDQDVWEKCSASALSNFGGELLYAEWVARLTKNYRT